MWSRDRGTQGFLGTVIIHLWTKERLKLLPVRVHQTEQFLVRDFHLVEHPTRAMRCSEIVSELPVTHLP